MKEIADRVFVLRHEVLDVNATLVLGDDCAVVIDTLSTAAQATELVNAVRRVTDRPYHVVNTHHHFDHCFGNATLNPVSVHAHPEAAASLTATDPRTVAAGYDIPGLAEVVVRPPDVLVRAEQALGLGGREVVLRFLGRGHTAGDLVVHVPDVGVVVAGDLIEESGPPQFDDAYPLEWPDTVAALLSVGATAFVPGHGAVVDAEFVLAQHAELAALDWAIREGHADSAPVEAVAARAPFGVETATVAVRRGFQALYGTA
ncbi:MBL fold metallo-hydrolase [Virgisporangium aliadipatigenens]|uniref:MBL fold metallo-hydrolase n=1 Tax=Virgisporangium aliadipatigenens TaxID=741659 RepID=A0A8J3YPL9_9ACTN|nr:MBL fold metallo-hydrolase [Virgisporangium aliadipatigenens]GIJ47483.1 MBL fold metallo-hydrolase [Virgisporangium aliadipatigenens]